MKRVAKRAILPTALVIGIAGPALATTYGLTVDGFGSNTAVGLTEAIPALRGDAIEFFIPLADGPDCVYGVSCGTAADSGNGGERIMSMFVKYDPVETTGPAWLMAEFEDLDLVDANDPVGFFESLEVFDERGTSLTGPITNIGSPLVSGNVSIQTLLGIELGMLPSSTFWARFDFSSSFDRNGRNTPEYMQTWITAIPIPSGLLLLVSAFGVLALLHSRRRPVV